MLKYILPIMLLITFSACTKSDIISIDKIHKIWVLESALNESGEELDIFQKSSKMVEDTLYLTGIEFSGQSEFVNSYLEGDEYHLSGYPAFFDQANNRGKWYQTKKNKLILTYAFCGMAVFEYEIEVLTENELILYGNSPHEGHDTELRLYYQRPGSNVSTVK
jgi:hypothetical protein